MKILGVDEITENSRVYRALCAEFVGTFLLIFIGCGSILFSGTGGPGTVMQISFTFGLCVTCLALCIGHVSGCHVNPAVTLSFMVVGKCYLLKGLLFMVVQFAAATAGFYALTLVAPDGTAVNGTGMTTIQQALSPSKAVVIEAIGTFFLCLVIHGVCDEKRSDVKGNGPLAIGLTIAVVHLFGINYTGSSLNPARSFGPAAVYGIWDDQWIYWAGPIIGGIVASIIYKLLFQARKGDDEANSYDF